MLYKFKVGDKVKIPRTKSYYNKYSAFMTDINGYDKDYLIVSEVGGSNGYDYYLSKDDKWPHISRGGFMERDLEAYEEEFVLPKKWYIVRNEENADVLNKWENDTFYPTHTLVPGASLKTAAIFYSDKCYDRAYSSVYGYTEITFEQFQKHVLNKVNMNKKIIGYKAPMDICKGSIKKGDILKPLNSPADHLYEHRVGGPWIPKELVETWEPVYEEEKIVIAGYEAKLERHVAGDCIAFGCQKIKQYQLEFLKSLLSVKEADFKLTAKGEEITVKTIESLLNMLK